MRDERGGGPIDAVPLRAGRTCFLWASAIWRRRGWTGAGGGPRRRERELRARAVLLDRESGDAIRGFQDPGLPPEKPPGWRLISNSPGRLPPVDRKSVGEGSHRQALGGGLGSIAGHPSAQRELERRDIQPGWPNLADDDERDGRLRAGRSRGADDRGPSRTSCLGFRIRPERSGTVLCLLAAQSVGPQHRSGDQPLGHRDMEPDATRSGAPPRGCGRVHEPGLPSRWHAGRYELAVLRSDLNLQHIETG